MLTDPKDFRRARDLSKPEVREELRQLLREAQEASRDHFAWAEISEEAGEPALALREYQLALRDRPGDVRALERVVVLYRERGHVQHTLSCAERWARLDPHNASALRELVSLYLDNDMAEQAAAAVEEGRQRGLAAEALETLRQAIRAAPAAQDAEEQIVASTLAPTEADVARFVHLFSGRENVYARRWHDASGEHGYTPVHQPFTFAVAKNHLLGNPAFEVREGLTRRLEKTYCSRLRQQRSPDRTTSRVRELATLSRHIRTPCGPGSCSSAPNGEGIETSRTIDSTFEPDGCLSAPNGEGIETW